MTFDAEKLAREILGRLPTTVYTREIEAILPHLTRDVRAAYEAGAMDMRERAAQLVAREDFNPWLISCDDAIRALDLTPPDARERDFRD